MRRTDRLLAIACLVAGSAACTSAAEAKIVTFAQYSQINSKKTLDWYNPVVPAVYKTIPAVYQTTPAVYQNIPAVTKVVNGKTVVVTPAQKVLVSPATKTLVTPAQKILVTPAHDSAGGVFQSTATANNTFGAPTVSFQFTANKRLAALGPLRAVFTLLGSAGPNAPASAVGGQLVQPDVAGSFAFTYAGATPLKVFHTTYLPGANLLTGAFSGLDLSGAAGGTSATAEASTSGGDVVTYSSDFLNFSNTVSRDVAFHLTSINTLQAAAGSALHTFTASGGAQFSSNPRPILSAVPEPGAWALMIAGIGLTGLALRSRRGRSTATAAVAR